MPARVGFDSVRSRIRAPALFFSSINRANRFGSRSHLNRLENISRNGAWDNLANFPTVTFATRFRVMKTERVPTIISRNPLAKPIGLFLKLLAAHVNLAVNDIDDEAGECLPEVGDREFDFFVNRAFEESRAVSRAESLLDQAIDGGFGDVHAFTLARHLPLYGGQIKLGDLFHLV